MIWSIVATTPFAASLAQASQPAKPQPTGIESFFLNSGPMTIMLVVLVLMWVFIFSSKRKEDRKKRDLLGNIKRGDEVQTIGGIIGKVVQAEKDKVLLKVDESSNTKIWFARNAIFRVLGEEAKSAELPAR